MTLWILGADGLLGKTLRAMAPLAMSSTKQEADITHLESLYAFVKKHGQVTHIVNASAFSLVDLAEKERELAHQVNAVGPENLGKVAKTIGAKLIHISTDYVFPGALQRPLCEEDETGPLNFYGKTKLEGEIRLLSFLPEACVIRTSALFGRGGKNFVASLAKKFQEEKEIRLTHDQYNSPTFVEDLARAILEMFDQSGIYHFSNQGLASKYLFGSAIYDHLVLKNRALSLIPVSHAAFPQCVARPAYSVFDTTKIQKCLSFPIETWQDALARFLKGASC